MCCAIRVVFLSGERFFVMEGEDGGMGSPEKEDYEGSSHSTPQEHRSFAEFAKDKLDSGKLLRDSLYAEHES